MQTAPSLNPDTLFITKGNPFVQAVHNIRQPLSIVENQQERMRGLILGNTLETLPDGFKLCGILPALYPEWLGDRNFLQDHGIRFAYIAGEMARGIASVEMVEAMAKAGMLGFFGAGGLNLNTVESALVQFQAELGDRYAWGVNLIHSPQNPALESAVVELCLRHQVRRLSASAFMALSLNVVRYAFSGIHVNATGQCIRPNRVFAKISRPEVAMQFMSPPPKAMLDALLSSGALTQEEVRLAKNLPVAENITVEADSGGHTDSRPLTALFPIILALRDELRQLHGYTGLIHVGAAGGLATPSSVAAAFTLGAAYVVTGSINQSAVESGLSVAGRAMLAKASVADMAMAPAGDMFEIGAKVQVLQKGVLFPQRASRLYELYRRYESLDAIPEKTRQTLERDVFQMPLEAVWAQCLSYFSSNDPVEITRAERDPHHRMALVFRWYLGMSSRWPIDGTANRQLDYQIWSGPAMGAFNDWVRDSFLAEPDNRSVVQIALNLLEGAAVVTRAHQLRCFGLIVPYEAYQFKPHPLYLK